MLLWRQFTALCLQTRIFRPSCNFLVLEYHIGNLYYLREPDCQTDDAVHRTCIHTARFYSYACRNSTWSNKLLPGNRMPTVTNLTPLAHILLCIHSSLPGGATGKVRVSFPHYGTEPENQPATFMGKYCNSMSICVIKARKLKSSTHVERKQLYHGPRSSQLH